MKVTLDVAVSSFGLSTTAKLSNPIIIGAPEDQLRAPFEKLLQDIAILAGLPLGSVVAVGESSLADLKTRPDYIVTVQKALAGFIELKAPGKGSDPRKFKAGHDKEQWDRLRSLPNLVYSDGNSFSLWQNGDLANEIVYLDGDVKTSGALLKAPTSLQDLFTKFLLWKPIPPRSAKDLAHISARLCRLLRDEVFEQLNLKTPALTALAADWRKLLFPDASDLRFADGYAQVLTFGLLMARAEGITLTRGFHEVAKELGKANSLIGTALGLLTESVENQATLKTSLSTLARVLDAVDWLKVSKGEADAWLYFYEDFLEVYDKKLRKLTGSYYTPAPVVEAMVRLVDENLQSKRFSQHAGLASTNVTIADPAAGTGTYLLEIVRRIAVRIEADEGSGAVKGAINMALKRLIAFEIQLGPFAVSQLRLLAEIVTVTKAKPSEEPRMFVADTLGNPDDDQGWIPGLLQPIADSRKEANKIKRDVAITVVIGNPPYKEKAKGMGGWVEGEDKESEKTAPLADWKPPRKWGVGAHAKHLRNLYVYFWRWATWKVFDHHPESNSGMVCFITVAGFLNGPGFQKMRSYLRETCDDIWIIDCSPEGHQPPVNTRIFQGVQQPVCIMLASRSSKAKKDSPATVHFRALPNGSRETKFAALDNLRLEDDGWQLCPAGLRDPFLTASAGPWSTFPSLDQLFLYNGSGSMPGRTWIIGPDRESLERRWQALVHAKAEDKETLFHPHLRKGKVGDKHSKKIVTSALAGYAPRVVAITEDTAPSNSPVRYGFRSFDRQWIIPDSRLINQPNPELWAFRSEHQVFLTALSRTAPTSGPALTFTALVPDLDQYNGRGGRVFPLWADSEGNASNIKPALIDYLAKSLGAEVDASAVMAYIAAIAAHPGFAAKFRPDLSTPGLRIPITADRALFFESVNIGYEVIWLQTFGERMIDPEQGRPMAPPRMPNGMRPTIPAEGEISNKPEHMPDSIKYDEVNARLLIGDGWVDNVTPAIWRYEVSGKQVLLQWFSYRCKNRNRPIIGERRPPSLLGDIQPNYWLAEYTSELINVLNILGRLIQLEPAQKDLLERICSGPIFSLDMLKAGGALASALQYVPDKHSPQPDMFGAIPGLPI